MKLPAITPGVIIKGLQVFLSKSRNLWVRRKHPSWAVYSTVHCGGRSRACSSATQGLVSTAEGLLTPCVLHAGPRGPCVQRKLSTASCASSTFLICLMHEWQSCNVLLLLSPASCLRECVRSLEHCHGCGARGKHLPFQKCPELMLLLRERRKKLPVKQTWLNLPNTLYFLFIPVWLKLWSMRVIISSKNLVSNHCSKSGWFGLNELCRIWHVIPKLLKSNVNLKKK